VSFCVLFVCKCVLYYCHRVTTKLQLINISIYLITEEKLSSEFSFLISRNWIKCCRASRKISRSSFLCVMSIQISDQNANIISLFAGNYPSVVKFKILFHVLPLGQKL